MIEDNDNEYKRQNASIGEKLSHSARQNLKVFLQSNG